MSSSTTEVSKEEGNLTYEEIIVKIRAQFPERFDTQVATLTEKFSALNVAESPENIELTEKYNKLAKVVEEQRELN